VLSLHNVMAVIVISFTFWQSSCEFPANLINYV